MRRQHVHLEEASRPADLPARHGRDDRAAAPRRHDPGAHGAGGHRRPTDAAHGVRLLSAWRDHERVDAGRCRRSGPARQDPRAARGVQGSADDRQRAREPPCVRPGARDHARHVAFRSVTPSEQRFVAGYDGRPNCRTAHRSRHATAVDRSCHGSAKEDRCRCVGR